MNDQAPLDPDALEVAHAVFSRAFYKAGDSRAMCFEKGLTAYLAAAQPVVGSVEALPAKVQVIAWEGGQEFSLSKIPDGHVFIGVVVETDRRWSLADDHTLHVERKRPEGS